LRQTAHLVKFRRRTADLQGMVLTDGIARAARGLSSRHLFAADPDSEDERHIEEERERRRRRLGTPERWVSLILAVGFLAAASGAPLVLHSPRSPGVLLIAALVAAYALASLVEFEVGTGQAAPTQLVLVPMLFLLPLGLVPICVAAARLFAEFPRYVTRKRHPERATVVVSSCWYAVGPVLVLGLGGGPSPSWGDAPLYALALGAQFAFDLAASAGRAWFAHRIGPAAQLRDLASRWAVDVVLAPMGLFVAFASVQRPYTFLASLPLLLLIAVFARERRARIDKALELSGAYRGTALLLGDVVEADDEYTGAHSRDVVSLVAEVADRLGLDARDRRNAEFAALLHDIGKIGVPKQIVHKPAPLSPDEWTIMRRHTIEGERMLRAVGGILGEVGEIIRSCHEHWDGGGYPDGLAGEEIPLIARIVSVCDAYSAITTTRAYRTARTPWEAIVELERCAGFQFDPSIVAVLAEVVGASEAVAHLRLVSPPPAPKAAVARAAAR
jgi:HD-GYP domain-containing protein (c-di-GMP phosphodiesterase class II)